MNIKEDKMNMIDIEWANKFTDYLQGLELKV